MHGITEYRKEKPTIYCICVILTFMPLRLSTAKLVER